MNEAGETPMDAIAELVGWHAAARLAARLGGKTLHVPETVIEGHPIALALGEDKAARLIAAMAGETVELPTTRDIQDELERARRDEVICEMAARGIEKKTIARWLRVDHRTVGRILSEQAAVVDAYKVAHPRRPEAH